ncbi:hypothetical protein [Streptomyces sp. CB02959]|uniref:hypothetical protein n=1 Tax=Streptomyces sp. CB02959 TaxID=2020330 RepID=UPI0015E0D94F|nr:hypothetical protein [Streptomyces sp. CB02959]
MSTTQRCRPCVCFFSRWRTCLNENSDNRGTVSPAAFYVGGRKVERDGVLATQTSWR